MYLRDGSDNVSQGRITADNCTCRDTEIEVLNQTRYLTQFKFTDTEPSRESNAQPLLSTDRREVAGTSLPPAQYTFCIFIAQIFMDSLIFNLSGGTSGEHCPRVMVSSVPSALSDAVPRPGESLKWSPRPVF